MERPAMMEWRCFHCDEVFTDATEAAQHFGTKLWQEPACQIDIAKYREMEILVTLYREEDTDLHRQVHAAQNKAAHDARRANERGYAQALADIRKNPGELGLMPVEEMHYPDTPEEKACFQCMTFDFISLQEYCATHKLGHGLISKTQEIYFNQFPAIKRILLNDLKHS
jgi:hypothetical protein